jgi:ABC-type bacteriocin/lantibiotic exporter with double-glycine peptidase domain
MGRRVELAKLRREASTNSVGTTLAGMERAAKAEGLKAEAVQMDLPALKRMEGMGIAWVDGNHYVAALRVEGDFATIRDPNHETEERIGTEQLLRRSGGIVLRLAPPGPQ